MMFLTVTIVLILIFYLIVFAGSAEKITAVVSDRNGSSEISVFNVDGNKCVNIRDLAVILKSTKNKFDFNCDGDNVYIERKKDYSGEEGFFVIDDNSPGYSSISADFHIGENSLQCSSYIIKNEYFINIEDISKIIDCDVRIDSDSSKIYMDKKIERASDISEKTDSIKVLSTIFDNSKIDTVREKFKQAFIAKNGEKSLSEKVQKRLDSVSMCSEFQLLENEIKIKVSSKYASVPYSELSDCISDEFKNYAVISLYPGENENEKLWCVNTEIFEETKKLSEKTFNKQQISAAAAEAKDVSDIDVSKPVIALTFDDGPKNGTTNKILDVLEKYDARATFFVVGEMVEKAPELVKREYDIGCQVGNHSYSHPILTKLGLDGAKAEINKTSDLVFKATGEYTRIGRPPYGALNHEIKAASGFEWFNWSIDTLDWKSRNTDSIYKKVMESVGDGDVILMHDLYTTTVQAVEKIVPELTQKGFQLVTMQELIDIKGGADKISGHIKK